MIKLMDSWESMKIVLFYAILLFKWRRTNCARTRTLTRHVPPRQLLRDRVQLPLDVLLQLVVELCYPKLTDIISKCFSFS